jgi:hypothetical protein
MLLPEVGNCRYFRDVLFQVTDVILFYDTN